MLPQTKGSIHEELTDELEVFVEFFKPLLGVNVCTSEDHFSMILILSEIFWKKVVRQSVSKRVDAFNIVAHIRRQSSYCMHEPHFRKQIDFIQYVMVENSEFLRLPQLSKRSSLPRLAEIMVADNHRQELVDESEFKYYLASHQFIFNYLQACRAGIMSITEDVPVVHMDD